MKNIFRIVKINLRKFIASLNTSRSPKKKKNGVLLLVIVSILLFASFFGYAYAYGEVFNSAGCIDVLLVIGVAGGGIMSFITSVTSSQGYIYTSSDTELLLSLPIKKRDVVISKILSLYFTTQFTSVLIMIPFGIVYAIFTKPSFAFYIALVIVSLVADLAFVCLGILIGFLVGLIINGKKHKNLYQIILTIVFLVGFLVLYGKLSSSIEIDIKDVDAVFALKESMEAMKENMIKYILPVRFAYLSMMGSALDCIWLLAISVLPLLAISLLIERKYLEMINIFNKSYRNKDYKLTAQNGSKVTKTLMKKDFRVILSSPAVALNTVTFPIFTTLMAVMMIVMAKTREEFSSTDMLMYPLIVFSSLYTVGGCLISLEGSNFEILKSTPINQTTIIKAKQMMAFLLALPFALINAVIVFAMNSFNVYYLLIMIVSLMSDFYFASTIGLYINIKKPDLHWDNPIKPVKQSISVLLTMVFGILFGIFNCLTIILTRAILGNIGSIVVTFLLVMLACFIATRLLYRKGAQELAKLEI